MTVDKNSPLVRSNALGKYRLSQVHSHSCILQSLQDLK
jgi:hypothetical protein